MAALRRTDALTKVAALTPAQERQTLVQSLDGLILELLAS
jgi:hypothetical protein